MASTEGSVKPTEASGGFVCAWPEERLGDFPLFLLLKSFSAHANPSRMQFLGCYTSIPNRRRFWEPIVQLNRETVSTKVAQCPRSARRCSSPWWPFGFLRWSNGTGEACCSKLARQKPFADTVQWHSRVRTSIGKWKVHVKPLKSWRNSADSSMPWGASLGPHWAGRFQRFIQDYYKIWPSGSNWENIEKCSILVDEWLLQWR